MDRKERFPFVAWLATIDSAAVVGYGGDVPTRLLVEIQRKIAELPDT
jgi:hypothetical protein